MLNGKSMFLLSTLVAVMFAASFNGAYAHKSEVIGDYNFEIGWDREPPIIGMENSITLMVTVATDEQKGASEMDHDSMSHNGDDNGDTAHDDHDESGHDAGASHENMAFDTQHDGTIRFVVEHDEADHDGVTSDDEHGHMGGVSGLASSLDMSVVLNDKKTDLTMIEDEHIAGLYHGKFTPMETGHPIVNFFGVIDGMEIEATFHPETVEEGALIKSMSSDGTINVDVIATKPSADQPMLLTVEFTDAGGEPVLHMNYALLATQGGTEVLTESEEHAHHGKASYSTEILSSDAPVDVQVKILGIGLPDEQASWTGPKDDTIPVHVTPEFGSIVMVMLGVAILSLVAVMRKSNAFPRFSSQTV